MKKIYFIAALLTMFAGLQTAFAQKVILNFTNGEKQKYDITQLDSIYFEERGFDESGEIDGREYIDLGLPSGTLWATKNVGADYPQAIGDYLAWGETQPRDEFTAFYDWRYYKYCNSSERSLTKYCTKELYGMDGFTDGLTELLPEDDAAYVRWGSNWQTPSIGQLLELTDTAYTTIERTRREDGGFFFQITSKKNGNSIILPSAGTFQKWEVTTFIYADYWSRSLASLSSLSTNAQYLELLTTRGRARNALRCYGMPIRPVRYQTIPYVWLVNRIKLTEARTLYLGQKFVFSPTVIPSYATNPELTFESSDENVVTISSKTATAVGIGTCTVTCRATDGSGVFAQCRITVDHKTVDLGLPSGTLWATYNVGADTPEGYGDHFAWGETKPKENYDWTTYAFSNGSYLSMTKYCSDSQYGDNHFTDNLTELLPEDDAATANWGEDWQMPSQAQMQELFNSQNTEGTWKTENGVFGRLLFSKTTNDSIFLPFAGRYYETTLQSTGDNGCYWSRTLAASSSSAFAYYMYYPGITWGGNTRCYGFSVRPVKKQYPVESIELSDTELSLFIGDIHQLMPTIHPSNTSKALTWESSDQAVATVSNDGTVSAVGVGSCAITCRATDGTDVFAECLVSVENNP